MYFVVRENVHPNRKGVLLSISDKAIFYIKYFSLTEVWLHAEFSSSLVSPQMHKIKVKVKRNS